MSCLRGAGAAEGTVAGDIAAAAEGSAAVATTDGLAAGGEEGLTQGLNEELCPPRVFAMVGLAVGEEG